MIQSQELPYHDSDPIYFKNEFGMMSDAVLEMERGSLRAGLECACKKSQAVIAALRDESSRLGSGSAEFSQMVVEAENLFLKTLKFKELTLQNHPDLKFYFDNIDARLGTIRHRYLNR